MPGAGDSRIPGETRRTAPVAQDNSITELKITHELGDDRPGLHAFPTIMGTAGQPESILSFGKSSISICMKPLHTTDNLFMHNGSRGDVGLLIGLSAMNRTVMVTN